MNPERWARIEALFDRAKLLPEEQWPLFLAQEATDDLTLVDEVLAMLRARAQADFIRAPGSASDAGPPRPDKWVGRKLGEFELIERIGHGGMGVVYRARQESLKRDVAVKVLPFASLSRPNHVARFIKEAHIAAKLRHRNVVAIHAVSQADELHWFAMELVDGSDLSVELKRLRGEADGVPSRLPKPDSKGYYAAVAELVAQAADGLACAHAAGVIHRDVKPSNLLLDKTGTIRLVDFGLARDDPKSQLSAAGEQIGTPHYMSPEQVRRRLKPVDARTDVYSLGVVLYEMLTLRRPFDGKTSAEIWWKIAHHEPPALRRVAPRVPLELATICSTAMSRRVFDRYPDAAAFRDDLRRFLNHEAIHARPLPLHRRAGRWMVRRRAVLAGAVVAVAALAGGVGGSNWSARSQRIDALVQQVDEAGDAARWDGKGVQLAALSRECRKLRAEGIELSGTAAQRIAEFERAIEAHVSRLEATGLDLLVKGKADRPVQGVDGQLYRTSSSERWIGEGLRQLAEASAISGDDPRLAKAAAIENGFAKVSIRLAETTATAAPRATQALAWRRPIDDLEATVGAAIEMGPLPLVEFSVPPGHWRFVVEVPEWGFVELTRDVAASVEPLVLVARVPEAARLEAPDSATPMKRIDGGTFTFRRDPNSPQGCARVTERVAFDSYWIDEAELSNREVVAWLEESGAPPPFHWSLIGYSGRDWRELPFGDGEAGAARRDRFLDLPSTGLTLAEVTACVEWFGKRLPTHVELERAQRGAAGLFHPWEGLVRREDAGKCNIDGPSRSAPLSAIDSFRTWLDSALPVRADGYRQHPEGLFHSFGNVSERTDSWVVDVTDQRLVVDAQRRLNLGAAWDAVIDEQSLASHATHGISATYFPYTIGVRCVRSAVAPSASTAPR